MGRQVLKPSYAKNSNYSVLTLKFLNVIDKNIFLFTANATENFPNIKTEDGLRFLMLELDNLIFKLESNWLRNEYLTDTKLLLSFSVFQF